MQVAIVQHSPVILDAQQTMQKAIGLVAEAAAGGAKLVIFPEAFFPGYPAWIWRLRPGGDWGISDEVHHRLLKNAVVLETDDLKPLREAAAEHQLTIVAGINERDGQLSRSTLYNSVVTIGPDGSLLNRHRKLMPTNPERMVWGQGDASGLKVIDTPCGRIGSLICWENYMPLARFALYAQGVEIYVAPTYDSGDDWLGTMQHIAREGCCWVISAGVATRHDDIPDDFPEKERLYPDDEEWINPGDSVVISPRGNLVAGPFNQTQEIITAEIDLDEVAIARRGFDVAGHYSRPDIFTLHIDRKSQTPVDFE
ncbi:carbon-nitrogen hydrolase family protein [Solemya velum gill symbiont]|uniref:carbon-nitrogen hydrolase family protein n=1 Tax=Solemya velum gill symbiont TaxID=2340 RepID=UPI000998836B|nr:carbon-nitrogen hydrolase family protein [Solemya velum gill symbiont]OOY61146.1 nitrilase [Solemya velum gill symbiont]OOY75894.1 nitrilase [Solemya velum gill symbiont]OOY83251.1 nitrilase [Solemya velum gill symbiont]OOY84544.1 nitrilase [Solemya velum gill symbiont]OOY91741.1 nitrilase [Solemya velum gill symbiont]